MSDGKMTIRLVDALYTEAMILADEARAYFDDHGRDEREALPPHARVTFTCESLRVTTRLMHIIAWLLTRRAIDAGEISRAEGRQANRRLGMLDETRNDVSGLPETARLLIADSRDLYERVARLDRDLDARHMAESPAHDLLRRLQGSF